MKATGPGWELRCGAWQDVLADVTECDALITDPPYGERTHRGQCHGRRNPAYRHIDGYASSRGLGYVPVETHDLPCWPTGWACVFSCSDLLTGWRAVAEDCGRTTFAPLACVITGMNVRLAGDGPSNWTVYLNVSRPKALRAWGTLRGAYVGKAESNRNFDSIPGAKPLWLMRAIIRDYSRPGDMIVDPYAGSGTTLLAAVIEGRRGIGAEIDPKTFELARKRLEAGYTPQFDWAVAQ